MNQRACDRRDMSMNDPREQIAAAAARASSENNLLRGFFKLFEVDFSTLSEVTWN